MKKRGVLYLAGGFALCLFKGVIGVLGSSEALAADGLCSFYQSYAAGRSLCEKQDGGMTLAAYRSIGAVGLLVSKVLIVGTCDVLFYSFVRISKAAHGTLLRPSRHALYAALAAAALSAVMYRHHSRSFEHTGMSSKGVRDVAAGFRLSIISSLVAAAGIAASRYLTLSGDAVAASVITVVIVVPKAVALFRANIRLVTDWMFYGSNAPVRHGDPLDAVNAGVDA